MTKKKSHTRNYDRLIELAQRQGGVIRASDARNMGIHTGSLTRLCRRGDLQRVSFGTYILKTFPASEHQTAVEAAARVPKGVLCLLSALQFHGITTQMPHQLWMAIPRPMQPPRVADLPIRFVSYSQSSFVAGIEEHDINGAKLRVYTTAKTIADCFKFRSAVGQEVAIEALSDAWSRQMITVADLTRFAKLSRVWNVIKPYAESIIQ